MINEEELKRRIEERIKLWEKYLNEIESMLGYGDIDLYSAVYDSCPALIIDELKWVLKIMKESEINV
jgi:hypothetical protein